MGVRERVRVQLRGLLSIREFRECAGFGAVDDGVGGEVDVEYVECGGISTGGHHQVHVSNREEIRAALSHRKIIATS